MPTATQSIREIVSTQPSAAQILHRFDIDLCSHADQSLGGACKELQLSVNQVLEKLADAEAQECAGRSFDPASLPIGRLIQYIVRVHHQCVRQELPRLAEMARNVAAKCSDGAPELPAVCELLEELHAEMYAHIQKEEQVLFPFISQMAQDSLFAHPRAHACFGSVAQPILMMEQEHESSGHIMAELGRLTNDFRPQAWACATHVALFAGLREFAADFQQHVHLENDILFPRAIELESQLNIRS